METWDAIRSRRNVREFSDQPVTQEHLDRIVEAGRLSPSARNWQPWDFVLVTDSNLLTRLAQVWRGAWHVARASAVIGVVAPILEDAGQQKLLYFDLGQAVMAMMLAATDLGIGTGHAAVADQDLARELLSYPPDRFLAYMLSLGVPSGEPLRPLRKVNRRAFAEVVHREHW